MKRHGVPVPVPERDCRPESAQICGGRLPGRPCSDGSSRSSPSSAGWVLRATSQRPLPSEEALLLREAGGLVPAGLQWPRGCSPSMLGDGRGDSVHQQLSTSAFPQSTVTSLCLLCACSSCSWASVKHGLFPPPWPTLLCSLSPVPGQLSVKLGLMSHRNIWASPGGLAPPGQRVPAWAAGSREGRAGPSDSSWVSGSSFRERTGNKL